MVSRELAERYRIEAEIGQGGIGVVYRALDQKLGRLVALKVLRADAVGPSQRPRFEREAKALATLVHPNVVTILDCGVSESVPYLVMELLEGQSLAQALGTQPFPKARAQRVIRELLAALAYVHSRGLVHRDLKPGNVFLQRLADGGEQVKLLDFGLAKFLDREAGGDAHTLTRSGEVFGTPAYMSPEQWTADKVDARADVFSAAVVCFELIAGRKPFVGDGQELLRAMLVDAPPPLHEACAERVARPELERLLQRALEKRAHERQPSAIELFAELEAIPEPWWYEGKAATPERRSAAAAARDSIHLATAPTLVQRVAARPSAFGRMLRRLSVLGAWTLSFVSLLVIGVAATMIYLSRGTGHPEAREALEHALPPLREAVEQQATAAKAAVNDAVSSAAAKLAPAPAEQPATVAPAQAPAPVVRERARNPWRSPTPRALRRARTKIEAGQRGDDRVLNDLRRYNRDQPNDPRAHLLIARMFVNRGVWNEAAAHYKHAFDRDPSSRGDPRMLKDLVIAAAKDASSARALELIPAIYGTEALDAIARARARSRSSEERARLDRLARAIAAR